MNDEEILKLLNKPDKSGYLSREEYVLKNYKALYDYIIKFAIENNLENLDFNAKKWHTQYNVKDIKKCVCGKNIKWKNATVGYLNYCSVKCGRSNESKEKYKKTMLERYGVDHNSKTEDYIVKKNKTMLERYGVTHHSLIEKNQNKIIKDRIEKIEKFIQEDGKIIEAISKNEIKILCNHCKKEYVLNYHFLYQRTNVNFHKFNPCINCNPRKNTSYPEEELYIFLKNNCNYNIIRNDRTQISPKELDVYIPELQLAIELNGLYFHSTLFKDKNYHFDKWKKCQEKNIKLVQIWEDDWFFKNDIIKSRLLNLINKKNNIIYARKTILKSVNKKETDSFLKENHLQGSCVFKFSYGLYSNDDLVSIMTFGACRKVNHQNKKENEYELLRFCSKKNTNVVGAANKIFNYFVKNHNPISIISYANLEWGESSVYSKMNFKFDKISEPGYFYYISNKGVREHRFNWTKNKLISLGYDKNKTEEEIMIELGNYKCYNSGNEKWIWKNV